MATHKKLEARLGHTFSDPLLLHMALTHSSYVNEHGGELCNNERLEFLGDAVLELVVSEDLYHRFPEVREGRLTSLRAGLVKEASLAEAGREVELAGLLLMGRGEEAQGGRDRDALLADALEALIGAVFLDGGFEAARNVVHNLLGSRMPDTSELPRVKDFKTRLQEHTQRESGGRPVYSLVDTAGPDHEKVYEVRVRLPDGSEYAARGPSKKKAEQLAAGIALDSLRRDRA